jgi:integrase
VTGAGLAGVVAQRWHHASPATWNRHVATVRSFARYCEHTRILAIDGDVELQRRAEKHDHTRSIARASLERLWERRDIDLRERTLWRMLYETAARADEVLRLNIEDLDIPAKRARTRSKGGDVDWLFFGSGSARLLPRLIAGRRAGPVFLSSLRPSPARAPAAGDICPLTGHARLSYRRAAELLVSQTGWTLHQFRHSALTHLAENDVQLPLLMAKSRHRSLRTLQRYARPGPDAVAALTTAHDPGRRR